MKKIKYLLAVAVILVFANINKVEAAANPAFDDDNFYACVIDRLNAMDSGARGYDHVATDAELVRITDLDCSNTEATSDADKIASIKGIEKLTALAYLKLNYNKIASVNLSQNKDLIELEMANNELTSLDLTALTSLTEANLAGNEFVNKMQLPVDPNKLVNIEYAVKLPAGFDPTKLNESDNSAVAEICPNDQVKIKEVGKAIITVTVTRNGKGWEEEIEIDAGDIDNSGVSNPETGLDLGIGIATLVLVIGATGFLLIRKKSIFPQA